MVKFNSYTKKVVVMHKIGFRSIFDAKRAGKYLGQNESTHVSLSMEISDHQKEVLDTNHIGYYIITSET